MSEVPALDVTRLYRVENPNIPARPDGVVSHEDIVGQWFTPNLNTALNYMRKSTKQAGAIADGAQLVVADVPSDKVDAYHVTQHPVASQMDVENDNYLLPHDGSIPTTVIGLDETLGDLRSNLGNFLKMKEAKARVNAKLGELSLL